jgi:hypothetical protein
MRDLGLEKLAQKMKTEKKELAKKIEDELQKRKEEKEKFRKDYYGRMRKIAVLVDCYHMEADKEIFRLKKWAESQGLRFEITEDREDVTQRVKENAESTLFYLASDYNRVGEKLKKEPSVWTFKDWPPHVVVDPYIRTGRGGWYIHEYFVQELELIAQAQRLDIWHFDVELQTIVAGCLAKYCMPWEVIETKAFIKWLRGDLCQTKTGKKRFTVNPNGNHTLVLISAKDTNPVSRQRQWEVLCLTRKKYENNILLNGEWRSHRGGISFQKLVINTDQFSVN